MQRKSSSCRSKNHYPDVSSAMRAARRLEMRDGFKFRWYQCHECEQYHLATKRYGGVKVVSLDAIQQSRGE